MLNSLPDSLTISPILSQLKPVSLAQQAVYRIGIMRWPIGQGITNAIMQDLSGLGHEVHGFTFDAHIPTNIDLLFLHGPYAPFLPLLEKINQRSRRPKVIFWHTEGLPDLNLPWTAMRSGATLRSSISRWGGDRLPKTVHNRATRFRVLGDLIYAYRKGWIDLLADVSAVYAQRFNQHGLPTLFAPFGSHPAWHQDMHLERDIDVLWMGKWGSQRRKNILQRLRQELQANGVNIYMADNVEKPFIYGVERTRFLNRAKITLNLLRTWYDENSLRFCLAAPNRSLCMSEPLLNHVPHYQVGKHYISAPIDQLTDTILYYLKNEDERQAITTQAHALLTQELTMQKSISRILVSLTQGGMM